MVRVRRIELRIHGLKARCHTTWLHPHVECFCGSIALSFLSDDSVRRNYSALIEQASTRLRYSHRRNREHSYRGYSRAVSLRRSASSAFESGFVRTGVIMAPPDNKPRQLSSYLDLNKDSTYSTPALPLSYRMMNGGRGRDSNPRCFSKVVDLESTAIATMHTRP